MTPDEQENDSKRHVVQKPPSIQINQPSNPALIQPQTQVVSMVQPIQGQKRVYIRAPKFKHQSRVVSTTLSLIGLFLAIVTTMIGIFGDDSSLAVTLTEGVCCLSFNAAFVCEIIFYSKMIEHNKSHQKPHLSAITNIIVCSILTLVGIVLLFGVFLV